MILHRLRGLSAALLLLALAAAPAVAGGAGPMPPNSSALDFNFGATVGGMLCRTASGWAIVPAGSAAQVLTVPSGGGCPAWATPASGGNVSNTGTPAAGQVALFTNATTIQGVNVLPVSAGGTGAATAAGARSGLGAAASGSNSDITALTGMTTPLSPSQGGTGVATAAANLVFAGPTSGSAAAAGFRALVPADDPAAADGCLRLSLSSSTALAINPYGCNTLSIGGVPRVVTATTISPSVSASTLYYVYASWSGTAVTYALSTTGHITGSDGREDLSSGGSTPSAVVTSRLVGMVYTNTSGQFVDGVLLRGVANYFNRRRLAAGNPVTGATSSTSFANVGNLGYVLSWGDEAFGARISGSASDSAAGNTCITTNVIDGSAVGSQPQMNSTTANVQQSVAAEYMATLAEGVHSFSPSGLVSGGTCTWNAQQYIETRG